MSAPCSASDLGVVASDPVDADDEAEASRAAGFDPGERVLVNNRLRGLDPEQPGAGEEGVRRRLAGEPLALGEVPIDHLLEQVGDPGRLEHRLAVGARGDDSAAHARLDRRLGVGDRALVGLDALLCDQLQHQLVLAVPEPGDRLRRRRIVRAALLQLDPARLQERAHSVRPRLAVDVGAVVGDQVELAEGLAGALGARAQVLVEHPLPGGRVDLRGLREHAVEIEQARPDPVGKSEAHAPKPISRVSPERGWRGSGRRDRSRASPAPAARRSPNRRSPPCRRRAR